MINKEYRLTIDDLIVEYMILKVKLGYEPSYTIDEFMNFILYFEKYKKIYDVIYDGDKVFDRFFERKKDDWSFNDLSLYFSKKKYVPHMICDNDRIIAMNELSSYDYSLLNIYFMSSNEQIIIRDLIVRYLKQYLKRDIDTSINISDRNIELGECIAAKFICSLWREYVYKYVELKRWPIQCIDINDYLFNVDLAKIIKIPSIKDDVLSFYRDVSKMIGVMIENDSSLEIKNSDNIYLPYANYEYIFREYNDLFDRFCKECYFEVIVNKNLYIENCCYFDDYRRRVRSSIDDIDTKRLVKILNDKVNNGGI